MEQAWGALMLRVIGLGVVVLLTAPIVAQTIAFEDDFRCQSSFRFGIPAGNYRVLARSGPSTQMKPRSGASAIAGSSSRCCS